MADEGQGAPVGFGGRVFPNPTGIKPTSSEDIHPEPDKPVGGKLSIDNPPADPDKANGITPREHPLTQHFAKTPGARSQLGGHLSKNHPAIKMTEH